MATLALLIFCAVISGWTAALAQIKGHDLQGRLSSSHMQQQSNVTTHNHKHDEPGCTGDEADCRHGSKSVHPMLCAACFAIETTGLDIAPPRLLRSSPDAVPQAAMITTDHQPRSPPPKRIFRA